MIPSSHPVHGSDGSTMPLNRSATAYIIKGVKSAFTAVIQRDGKWWIGWIEEVPGANSQASTRKELLINLKSALREALKLYRKEALAAVKGRFEETIIEV